MPCFTAPQALETLKDSGLDIPLIVVSGTVGEETAVECMLAGAADFMVKGKLHRLAPAIERELREAKGRKSRQQVETELEESEDRFRNMADAASVMIWTMDPEGRITYINRRFMELTGNVLNKNGDLELGQLFNSEATTTFHEVVEQSLRLKEGFSVEHRVRDKFGQCLWIFTSTAPRFSADGKFLGLVGSSVDITDRKAAEEELFTRTRQQEIVTELGLDALTGMPLPGLIDKALALIVETLKVEFCKYLELQPGGEELLFKAAIGWDEDLIGTARVAVNEKTHVGYTVLSREPVVFENLATETRFQGSLLLRTNDIQSGLCLVLLVQNRPYGALCVHSKRWRRFTTDEQNFMQAVSNILSATIEQEQVARELREAKEEAEEANRKKSEFLAMMSHELRTPLNAILGFSQMMQNGIAGAVNPKQFKYLSNVITSGKHLLTIINDLLDISKVEAGKMDISLEWVELSPLLREVRSMMAELANHKNVALKIEVKHPLDRVHVDPARFRQILVNLISNAIKFNKDGGEVAVEICREEGHLVGSVRDTGIGISEENMRNLFTKFYQIDASSSRYYQGTGLGLALTRDLIELHGGEISVESTEGVGSTFAFRIPLQEAPVVCS